MRYICCSFDATRSRDWTIEDKREFERTLIEFFRGHRPEIQDNFHSRCVDIVIDERAWPYPPSYGDYCIRLNNGTVLNLRPPPDYPSSYPEKCLPPRFDSKYPHLPITKVPATPTRSKKLLLL